MPTGPDAEALRAAARSFGVDAERYDRSRPRYPEAVVDRLVAVSPGPAALDVGCGTGIVARQLQAAGCQVLGVDVDGRMAELARTHDIEVEVARFEDWDARERTFDLVVAGQTWHWIDPIAGAAKVAEVLRPGGRLAVMWNAGQAPPALDEAFAAVLREALPDSPLMARSGSAERAYDALADKAIEGMRTAGFGDDECWHHCWEHTYTRDAWLDQVPSHGNLTGQPPELVAEVVAGIGAAIDDAGGGFTMAYTTVVAIATLARH